MYRHCFNVFLITLSIVWLGTGATGQQKQPHGRTVRIRLKAMEGLHYDKVRFRVPPGGTVRLTLVNTDDMDHNLVFTREGKRKSVVAAALALEGKGPALHYIPDDSAVLWHVTTVRPDDSAMITFSVPETEGLYPYVCTYPGHGATMYGVMYVSDKPMPPLATDTHVPQLHPGAPRSKAKMHEHLHPYGVTPPYLIRTFMPDASPAAIAVALPDSVSYCWDAGTCRLRYAWKGRFLSHMDLWKRKGDETALVAGRIFFRDETRYPFLIGQDRNPPQIEFKGYRMADRYPEFHYRMGDVDVHELIKPTADSSGLVRHFRMTGVTKTIWFLKGPAKEVNISASTGNWQANRLALTPAEAAAFTITITEKKIQ